MSHNLPTGQSTARRIAEVVVAMIALNVLLRVVPLPDLDLPAISIPGWLHAVLKVKNWLLLAIAAVIVIGVVVEQAGRDGDAAGGDE